MPRNWAGIIAVEGTLTGDGRMIDRGALRWGSGPWPLQWSREDGGHDAPVVGEVLSVWRDGDLIRGEGVLHDDSADAATAAAARRVVELLESGTVGVSISLDDEDAEIRVARDVWEQWQAEMAAWMNGEVPEPEDPETDSDGRVIVERFAADDYVQVITDGRLREASIVNVAAFVETAVEVAPEVAVAASIALVASLSRSDRAAAFADPRFGVSGDVDERLVWQPPQRPEEAGGWGCPLTIDDDGRIYGHLALRNRCHGSMAACTPPPEADRGDFSRFLIGEAVPGVATGPIVLDTIHGVDERGRVRTDQNWLADTGRAVADVTVGTDAHGTWCAGMLRPGLSEREEAALRGSTLSGEWHPFGGRLRLVGILAVNAPGYLVQRRGVAASFTTGASCGCEPTIEDRLYTLEKAMAAQLMRGI